MNLTDDAIFSICNNMKISELEQFIMTSQKNYELCNKVLEDRINTPEFQQQLQLYNTKLYVLNIINNMINNLRSGQALDLSRFNIRTGKGIKIINTPGINTKLIKLDRLIYTYPGNYDLISNILSAENPYDIF